ncbi:MAG: glycosyltransferase family 2 protein [Wenzhouxiangella sp.]
MTETATPSRGRLTRVTALIVNYNSGPWLERCIRALRGRHGLLPVIEVVDNDSQDGSAERLPSFEGVRVRQSPRNLGFARGVNTAARAAHSEYLLIINPDCLLLPDSLEQLIAELDEHPAAGMVSGRIFDMAGNEQRGSRRVLPTRRRIVGEVLSAWLGGTRERVDLLETPAPEQAEAVEAVSGACMLIRRAAFLEVGGLDKHYPMHFEDVDLMARLREAGWQIRLRPEVIVSHAGGVSSRSRPVRVMWNKHRGLWRYLQQHPERPWPAWSRALWWLGIFAHALVMTPIALWRRR